MHEVKPISADKTRATHPGDPCAPKEISQPRGLNGAMQWRASVPVHGAGGGDGIVRAGRRQQGDGR
eukprot:6579019-Pyramimonas_sp.AAC.1